MVVSTEHKNEVVGRAAQRRSSMFVKGVNPQYPARIGESRGVDSRLTTIPACNLAFRVDACQESQS